jgi:hypothetical protein
MKLTTASHHATIKLTTKSIKLLPTAATDPTVDQHATPHSTA